MREELSGIRSEISKLREALPDNYLPRREFAVERAHVHERLEDLEAWQTWAMRLVMGAIIGAVLATALTVSTSAGAEAPTPPPATQEHKP